MTTNRTLRATVVVGNPKANSRTRAVGESLARILLQLSDSDPGAVNVVELSALGGGLLSWGDPAVAEAKAMVLRSDLLVVASPVYKASFTGLLKAFLDQFGRDELAARATVPLMVGAAPLHSLAVETQLRPVLIEIGASCPTRGLYVLEKDAEGFGEQQLAGWLAIWGPALSAVINTGAQLRAVPLPGR
jgi:FMN reductase